MSAPGRIGAVLRDADLLRSGGRMEETLALVDGALQAAGDLPPLLMARITVLRELGRCDAALQTSTRLLALHPHLAEAHLAEGFVRLLVGDWARGWACREWRWQQAVYRRLVPKELPVWDGSRRPGCRLRVIHEQGLGDFLQFSRYFPEVRERVGSLVVETPPPLLGLMRNSFPAIGFVSTGARVEADAWVGLMSLVERLQASPCSIPCPGGYLVPPEAVPSETGRLLHSADAKAGSAIHPGSRSLRVGLAPTGNPRHFNDRFRSLPRECCARLEDLGDVLWYRVQPECPQHCGLSLGDPPFLLDDMAATARWIQSLDLVITVDTSVAHLAGGLGCPVWILLPHAPDWRWGLAGDRTPWYASARLFRQVRPADWSTVMESLRQGLEGVQHARR